MFLRPSARQIDGGREANPAGAELGNADRVLAGLAQKLQQPVLLSVSERHRRIVALQRDWGGTWHPRCAPALKPTRINPPGSSHRGGSCDVGADNREPLTLTCDAGVNVM